MTVARIRGCLVCHVVWCYLCEQLIKAAYWLFGCRGRDRFGPWHWNPHSITLACGPQSLTSYTVHLLQHWPRYIVRNVQLEKLSPREASIFKECCGRRHPSSFCITVSSLNWAGGGGIGGDVQRKTSLSTHLFSVYCMTCPLAATLNNASRACVPLHTGVLVCVCDQSMADHSQTQQGNLSWVSTTASASCHTLTRPSVHVYACSHTHTLTCVPRRLIEPTSPFASMEGPLLRMKDMSRRLWNIHLSTHTGSRPASP